MVDPITSSIYLFIDAFSCVNTESLFITLSQLRGQSQVDVFNKYLLYICEPIYVEHVALNQTAANVTQETSPEIDASSDYFHFVSDIQVSTFLGIRLLENES